MISFLFYIQKTRIVLKFTMPEEGRGNLYQNITFTSQENKCEK